MRSTALVCSALLASCAGPALSPAAEADRPVAPAFDVRVRALLEQFQIPGAAVCVVDDGEILHEGVYGVADAATGEPVTPRTRFQVASVSKVIATWAAMSLVESGALALDAPIEDFTGDYRLPPSAFDARGVTAARLLAHTAGTSAWGFLGDPWTGEPLLDTRTYLERGGDDGGPLVLLEAEPGTRHRYSGGGFTLLQLAVEEASGQPFAEYVERAVYTPLGMDGAGFNGRRGLEAYAVGHDALGTPLPDDRYPALAAAAAYASLDDLKRFVFAHWGDETAPRGGGALEPNAFDRLFEVAPDTDGGWALGYEVIPFGEDDVEQLFGHTGDNPGYHSLVFVHPRDRDAFVILTNGDAGNVFRNQLLADWCELTGHERFRQRPVPVGVSLLGVVAREGVDAATAEYRRRAAEQPDDFAFGPRQLDSLAYYLVEAGKTGESTAILELNVAEFPDSTLAVGSLTERYVEFERYDAAEPLCRRLAALDPEDDRVGPWLETIASQRANQR